MSDPSVDDIIADVEFALPSERTRRRMSPLRLAMLLSEQQGGTPQYILVEHELNLRIAKVQSNATWGAAVCGIAGVVVGAVLQAWLQAPAQQTSGMSLGSSTEQTPPRRAVVEPQGPVVQPSTQPTASQGSSGAASLPPRASSAQPTK